MRRMLVVFAALVVLQGPAFAQRGDSEAVITHTKTTAPGVSVRASSYRAPSTYGPRTSSVPSASELGLGPSPRPNLCTGLVRGTEFVAFSQSPVCSAFTSVVQPVQRAPRAPQESLDPEDIALLLLDEAVARAERPDLRIAPGRVGLTGLDSFFWVDEPRTLQVSASVPGLSVIAEARPAQYVWDFGDGLRKTTSSPGRPWTRAHDGTIAHLYERRGSYEVRVEVIWEARWRVGGGDWEPLGYFSTSDAADYPVRQIVALLVKPR